MFFYIPRVRRVLCLASVLMILSSDAHVTAQEANAKSLPLKTVVMFTSGVGYYEHTAEIDGNQKVKMKFDVEDISDLLKSMVVEDQGGGTITSVNYESSDPLQHTLRTFAIDLTRNPSLADLFRQLRGQKVKLDTGSPLEGVIVGVERRRAITKNEQIFESDFVNLKTATGLRSIPIGNIQETQLLDAALDKELQARVGIDCVVAFARQKSGDTGLSRSREKKSAYRLRAGIAGLEDFVSSCAEGRSAASSSRLGGGRKHDG